MNFNKLLKLKINRKKIFVNNNLRITKILNGYLMNIFKNIKNKNY